MNVFNILYGFDLYTHFQKSFRSAKAANQNMFYDDFMETLYKHNQK